MFEDQNGVLRLFVTPVGDIEVAVLDSGGVGTHVILSYPAFLKLVNEASMAWRRKHGHTRSEHRQRREAEIKAQAGEEMKLEGRV